MTDIVVPSTGRQYSTKIEALLPRYNGGNWIIPSSRSPFPYPGVLDPSGLSEFDFTASDSGETLTIEGGEAVVGGRWLARDTQTTLSFTSSELSDGPTVYLTFSKSAPDTVILDSRSNLVDNPDASVAEDNLCYVCEYRGPLGWRRDSGRKTPVMTEQYPREHGSRHDIINGVDKIPNLAGGQVFVHTAQGSTLVQPNSTKQVTVDFDAQDTPILTAPPRSIASINTSGLVGKVFANVVSTGLLSADVELRNTTGQEQNVTYSVLVGQDLSDNDIGS